MAEPRHNVSIMACARWEIAYVTEWLLYHQAIGFDHVYLYCNDDDPTDLYGQVLPFCRGAAPFVTFHHFPYQGQQFYMMMHALRHHKDSAHWIAFLDIDEFLVLPELNDIKAYLQWCPEHWDSIHFNRSFFGNNSHVERPPGSVLRTYRWREDRVHPSTKTLTRSARIDLSRIRHKIRFWHGWDDVFGPDFHAVNVLGHRIDQIAGADGGASYVKPGEIQSRIRNAGFVNHYALKSARDYEFKLARGRNVDVVGRLIGADFIDAVRRDVRLTGLNAVEDSYLADYWGRYLHERRPRSIVSAPRLPNVALGKRADQSSVAAWLSGRTTQADAAGVLSGRITGDAQCHTGLEAQPWWSIDLGAPHLIYEIRVFNRVSEPDLRERLGAFHIEVADAADRWAMIYVDDGSKLIGGADGDPLILRLDRPLTLRWMRIVAHGHIYFHLDQVELYGVTIADAEPGSVALSGLAPPIDPAEAGRRIVVAALSDLIVSDQRATSGHVQFQHVTQVVPSGRYHRRAPVALDIQDLAPGLVQEYVSMTHQIRQDYLDIYHVGLAGAVVFGEGTVVTADGTALRDSCWEFFAQGGLPPGLSSPGIGEYRLDHLPSRYIERPSLLLKRPFSSNFGHWLLDAAMLLALLPDLDLPADWQLVIGQQTDPVMQAIVSETLDILAPGVPVVEHADHDAWTFASLQYVMPVQISPLIKVPRALAQLRSAFLAGRVRPAQRRRLYILRGGSRRRLENEAAVIELARRYDFEPVHPEHYSLREQVALFQSAECIMGVKGAALTNLMFCSGTTSVTVLSPSDWPDLIFWDIAGQLGIAYAEMFGPITATTCRQSDNSFRIDLDRLDRHLAVMCHASPRC